MAGVIAGLTLGLSPEWAWASSSAVNDTPIGTVLCTAAGWMTGNLGIGLAVIAVSIFGILGMLGRISWGLALLVGTGISVIFGVPDILGTASCSNSLGYSGTGGFGANLGLSQTVPYVNLVTVGAAKPVTTVPSQYGPGVFSTPLSFNTKNSPVQGFVQVVISGLPAGMTIVPYYPWEVVGENSSGDTIIDVGYFDVSGDGEYEESGDLLDSVYMNGVPYTGTSLPAGVTEQVELYDNFQAYTQGCPAGNAYCSTVASTGTTGQRYWEYNTSTTTNGTTAGEITNAGLCTAGICNPPPAR